MLSVERRCLAYLGTSFHGYMYVFVELYFGHWHVSDYRVDEPAYLMSDPLGVVTMAVLEIATGQHEH